MKDGINATHGIRAWVGMVVLAITVFAVPTMAASWQSQNDTMALNLYQGQCDRFDVLSAPESVGATPVISTSPPDQSYHFVLETRGELARLASEPHAIVVERNDGDLVTVAACGNVPAGTTPGETVSGLRDPADGALLGVAVLTEPTPGVVRIEAWLLIAAPGGDAIVDATASADPNGNADDEPEGGV